MSRPSSSVQNPSSSNLNFKPNLLYLARGGELGIKFDNKEKRDAFFNHYKETSHRSSSYFSTFPGQDEVLFFNKEFVKKGETGGVEAEVHLTDFVEKLGIKIPQGWPDPEKDVAIFRDYKICFNPAKLPYRPGDRNFSIKLGDEQQGRSM